MKKILFSLVATVFLSIGVETASACFCTSMLRPTTGSAEAEKVKIRLRKELKKASFVFSGEVIRLDQFEVTFKIEKIWKGSLSKEVTMSTGTRDNGNGLLTSTSCDYNFQAGKKYLVYTSGSGKEMQAYECGGTGELTRSEERIEFLKKAVPHSKSKKSSLH